ncbi:MAG TPA: divalent-cation tolerance protein CutA [Ramlibacter sp.]|nr:divalent-cation tolerance protein CutA [Ramlibacter sp.]
MSDAELQVLTVTTTVATLVAAQKLARRILDEHLAACVQLDTAVTSLYRWQGAMCDEPEVRLVIKTLPGREAALQALFAQHHPYALPQFVAVAGQASTAYARWVRDEVSRS